MWWDKAVYSKSYYVRLNQAVCRQQRTLMKNFQAKDWYNHGDTLAILVRKQEEGGWSLIKKKISDRTGDNYIRDQGVPKGIKGKEM